MSNRIRNSRIDVRRLSPTEAEVWITVEADASGAELRGKVTGPRCRGVTTVEIAYPFQRLSQVDPQDATLIARVLIPEPNLWTEATPFLYTAHIELWVQDECVDEANLLLGLKQSGR